MHVCLAAGCGATLGVWRAHVGRILTNDVRYCSFVLDHLLDTHVMTDGAQAIMGPRVRGDLVAFSNHPLDNGCIRWRGIDGTFSQVIAGDEECGREFVLQQQVQEFIGIAVRAVVVCQCYHVCLYAIVNVSAVRDFSEQWTWIIECRCSSRGLIRVTDAESVLTIRIGTIGCRRSTISLCRCQLLVIEGRKGLDSYCRRTTLPR